VSISIQNSQVAVDPRERDDPSRKLAWIPLDHAAALNAVAGPLAETRDEYHPWAQGQCGKFSLVCG
jgi:hypothetical protein